MKTELSILIPTYNNCCLELVRQLAEQARSIENLHTYEIIVADDGSTKKETVETNRLINNIEHCRYIERLENRGRAIIRNFLAQQACHVWLLYIDSDMIVIHKDFLKVYLTCAETEVVYGGYKVIGEHQSNLRFMYEKRAERKHTATMRAQKPYLNFHTSNFLVSKAIMTANPLDVRFRHYGYEDVLFSKVLQEKNIRIAHIDNPLGFDKFENNDSFLAKTEEDLFRLYPNMLVGLILGKNRPFFYATYDYKSTRNKYTENEVETKNRLTYGNGLFQIGNNFIFSSKFRITLRFTENVLSIDNGRTSWTKFYFSPSLLCSADLGHGNSFRGELYTYVNDPQLAYYNGSSQQMDQYQILRGNPDLKNGHCIGGEAVFDSNHKWGMFELLTQYINMPKYIYEDVSVDNDKGVFVHTYRNGRSYNHFLLNAEIRFNVIPKKLIWMVGGEYNYFKERDERLSAFVGGTDLTYLGKNLIGKVELVSPFRYLAKGVKYENPLSLKLTLKYTLKDLQIGFNATNPFMNSSVETGYTAGGYSNVAKAYNPRITSNMFIFTLSYRVSYGKKHNFQNIEMKESQSSGLLEQQNIRNEKMESGKK